MAAVPTAASAAGPATTASAARPASTSATARRSPASAAAGSAVALHALQSLFHLCGGLREILLERGVFAEGDQKGLVFYAHHAGNEFRCRVAFVAQQAGLAAADVDQQTELQRQVRVSGELCDGLLLAVLKDGEIVFCEIADQLAIIRESGVTILLIEHEMELIERLCDDVVVMAEGKFLTRGSFDEVTADRRVQECYLGVQLS